MEIKHKIKVPRDFRKNDISFIDEFPLALEGRIDTEIYKNCINEINSIFKPKYYLWNIIKMLSIVLYLVEENKTYDEELEHVLIKINNRLQINRMSFGHPKYTNYTEIILYIYN
ncbi:hypothetical protein AAJ76_100070641 [Vairimorpha ceranae]|uniref:Golgin subfamily A member 7/ERF4 domain-containing protein n=1 Tax=Vairimorpha ceranae TaxID=40302 RepID=A0A0F9WV80_9MICR|nr:hypothetical protein AAJ76_100070641 [Vairimorpha ceranae]KAF5141654.1 hypothetical protein G9O61_00g001960 [Vairimorpha ceranae]KKO76648.1 hypothetical protein AAJ76_100070641 [Vairimorpha ceranae]